VSDLKRSESLDLIKAKWPKKVSEKAQERTQKSSQAHEKGGEKHNIFRYFYQVMATNNMR
jgi:hypothetical protein